MKTLNFTSHNAADTTDLGEIIGCHIRPGTVIVLSGDLGAGKTHISSAIAAGLGIEIPVTSPTFAIIKNYPQASPAHPEGGRIPLNHMDLYRLEDPSQLRDLDIWDTVQPGAPAATIIEWGEMFDAVISMADLIIDIRMADATMPASSTEGSAFNADKRMIELKSRTERGEILTDVVSLVLAARAERMAATTETGNTGNTAKTCKKSPARDQVYSHSDLNTQSTTAEPKQPIQAVQVECSCD